MFSSIELAHVYNLKIDNDFALFRNRLLMADTGFKREILGRMMQIFIYDLCIVCQHGLSQMDTNDNTARIFLLLDLVYISFLQNTFSYIFSNCTLLFDKSFFRISVKKDNVHKCKKTFRKEGTKQIIWEKSYPQQMRRFYRQKWVIHELIHIIHRKKDKFCAFVRKKTEQRFCAIILKFTKIWNSIDFWIMKKLKNMSNNE